MTATRITGQAAKRGLIPRTPQPDQLAGDLETFLTAEYGDAIRSIRRRSGPDGGVRLGLDLHPAAPAVLVALGDGGEVTVDVEPLVAGPGYRRFAARIVERLGLELEIDWSPGPDGGLAALAVLGDRAAAERDYLGWLGRELIGARAARSRPSGGRPVHLGTPDGVHYTSDAAIATVVGPRDDAWLETAIADPNTAVTVTPWWADATDPAYLLQRALAVMWTEVRWRSPGGDDERATMDEVHRLLSRAFPIEPSLDYPWAAWAEIVTLRGIDDAMARQVVARAARVPPAPTPIGYRRDPVTIVHEGWALEIPGSFGERRTDDEWWGGEAGRSITLAATTTGGPDGPMPARAFLAQVAGELGGEALHHEAGGVIGRARLSTDASSGLEIGVLDGYSAVSGSGAAIRITFDDSADWQWALDTWRALAPA